MAQLPQPPNMQVVDQALQALAVELPYFLNLPAMAHSQALLQQMVQSFNDINAHINRLDNWVQKVQQSIADLQHQSKLL